MTLERSTPLEQAPSTGMSAPIALSGRQRLYARQKQVQRIVEQNLPWPVTRSLIRAGTASPWTEHHHRENCIFVHIPKNAGNSVSQAIYGEPFLGHDPLAHFYAFAPEEAERCFKFAFSRNPWDRLVSAYHYLRSPKRHGIDRHFAEQYLQGYATFEDFVIDLERRSVLLAWHHFRPQSEFLEVDGAMPVDFVGKVETIDEDFGTVTAKLGKDVSLPRLNRSERADYRRYYTDAAAERVGEIYAQDAKTFGYVFG